MPHTIARPRPSVFNCPAEFLKRFVIWWGFKTFRLKPRQVVRLCPFTSWYMWVPYSLRHLAALRRCVLSLLAGQSCSCNWNSAVEVFIQKSPWRKLQYPVYIWSVENSSFLRRRADTSTLPILEQQLPKMGIRLSGVFFLTFVTSFDFQGFHLDYYPPLLSVPIWTFPLSNPSCSCEPGPV